MEQLLEELPDKKRISEVVPKYFFAQPERVFINSINNTELSKSALAQDEEAYSAIKVKFPRPILNVKTIELISAQIPIPTTNIPDTETTFFYYRVGHSGVNNAPSALTLANLHMVRLLPSYYKEEFFSAANYAAYGFNRTFVDYADLSTELAKSCLRDPTSDNGLTYHIPGDISLFYDAGLNRFRMLGNNTYVGGLFTYYYIPAGYTDRNVALLQATLQSITTGDQNTPGFPGQPFKLYRTMNMRLGWGWDGVNNDVATIGVNQTGINLALLNRFRPLPTTVFSMGEDLYSVIATNFLYNTADSFGDLVYSSVCSIYTDVIGTSTTDTNRDSGLLATIPLSTANLGVAFWSSGFSRPLTKVSENIYEMSLEFRTDTGVPFYFPNSSVFTFELSLTY
jgi:hypothetical protein